MSSPFDHLTEADIPALLRAFEELPALLAIVVSAPAAAPPAPDPPEQPDPPAAIAYDYAAIAQAERRLRLTPATERVPIACSRCVDGWVLGAPEQVPPMSVVPWVACACNPVGRRVRG